MHKSLMAFLGMIALVVGFLITQQIRTVSALQHTAQVQEGRTLSKLVQAADRANVQTESRLGTIEARLSSLRHAPSLGLVKNRVNQVRPLAGLTRLSGAGIVVVLHDGTGHLFPGEPPALQLVHDQYVLRVIALISSVGAQAISINGQRYTATTSIYCAGPTIRINGIPYASPFVVKAIGPTRAMMAVLKHDPDIQGWSQLVSIRFHPARSLEIAPYSGLVNFSLAKPAKIEG